MSLKFYFSLIIINLTFLPQISPSNSKGKNIPLNIPSKYISSPSFIEMIHKTQIPSKIIYASPKNIKNSKCTQNSPCSLEKAINMLEPGYILYLRKGIYNIKKQLEIHKSGKPNFYIVISSAPNEKAIITSFTKQKKISLFQIFGSYIIIENLTFGRVSALDVEGIALYRGGQSHIIIRNNKFYELKSTVKIIKDEKKRGDKINHGANGILLAGEKKVIKKVIIYNNELNDNILGYSEAISITGNCEEIYVLYNKLKNNNNIGIDFNGNTGISKQKEFDQPRNSVAMYNKIEKSISPYDDCAGLYVDGAKNIYLGENIISESQYGIEIGNEKKKLSVKNIIVENNKMINNLITGIRIGGFDKHDSGNVKDSIIRKNQINGNSNSVIIAKAENILFKENEFILYGKGDKKKYFVNVEFSSSYVKNITFEKNVFEGNGIFKINDKKMDLDEFIKKYNSNKIKK